MSRQYAIKIRFQGHWYISEERWETFVSAAEAAQSRWPNGHIEYEIETLRSMEPFEGGKR